jgi:hypothetical protein
MHNTMTETSWRGVGGGTLRDQQLGETILIRNLFQLDARMWTEPHKLAYRPQAVSLRKLRGSIVESSDPNK